MTPDDRRAIDTLFQRLAAVEQRTREPRDPESEALINRRIETQPSAPYYMAQTVIVQQQALEEAERRMAELEEQVNRGGMGRRDLSPRERYEDERGGAGPWNRGSGAGMGGGFLAGAAQTAMGVAGGMLLGSMIGGLFGAGAANAAEAGGGDNAAADQNTDTSTDAGADAGGGDAGGDGGGWGDFGGGDFGDFGGDF